MSTEIRTTTCNRDCPDACHIEVTVEHGRAVKLAGSKRHPVTSGFLCLRTNRFLERHASPDRLTAPLLRRNGELAPVSWQEALDHAATELLRIRGESGPAAIFHYRSGGSLGLLKHLCDYFFERFGPVTTKSGDICSGAAEAAQELDFGVSDSSDIFQLLRARQVILWGKNIVTSSPHLVPILREARGRGAEAVLIDPVWNKTAQLCDRFLQVRPGGDLPLAMAVAHILFDSGWVDPAAASYCGNLEQFRELATSRSVGSWCASADLPVTDAADLARRLGCAGPATILVGWGMGRRADGGSTVRALDALAAVSGNLGIPGGGVSFYYRRRAAFDLSFLGGAARAPRTVFEPQLGAQLEALDDPPIRAVWVTAGNPVAMLPDSARTDRALRQRELVVVVDSFLTDTGRAATLVLPTTTMLEDDDIVGAYGHHWLGEVRPACDRLQGVRTDLEIMQELAARVGLGAVLAGSARDWKQRLLAVEGGQQPVSLDQVSAGPIRNPLAPDVLFADRRFPTPSGRVNLMAELPPLPEVPAPSTAFPLLLLSISTPRSQSSQQTDALAVPAPATVHPDSACGLGAGSVCRLVSPIGTMEVTLVLDHRQRKDVVLLPKGGHFHSGHCANALIGGRPTDLGGGGAIHSEYVHIEA
ncbi:MAG: molybdopterin-dependent oxidoreductase [Candidatus Schekmanbacteria bacterium]|nr:molybdopterin-dependent oxidoreductase [Candidatus Schekmanbacteria bacterium]